MKKDQFFYSLPESRIAQTPVEPRDASRLLVLNRQTEEIHHHHFFDLPNFLEPGDLLVLNNTRVLPVRLIGHKSTGGEVEILLTKRLQATSTQETWQALTRPGLKPGQSVRFSDERISLTITCQEVGTDHYTRHVTTSLAGSELLAALDVLGTLPTPPYIEKFIGDPERYQTVFAKTAGSAAAPTAGLHFTPQLLEKIKDAGIALAEVTLHVGLGTFLPMKADSIADHVMHREWYSVPLETAAAITATKQAGKRVIAVGTTVMRTLESAAQKTGAVTAQEAETGIFIYPPYQFQVCDALITNFHLPESTLLMLVSAFSTWPQTDVSFTNFADSFIGRAYQEAIAEEYRFFSFGDAMLIE